MSDKTLIERVAKAIKNASLEAADLRMPEGASGGAEHDFNHARVFVEATRLDDGDDFDTTVIRTGLRFKFVQ